MRLWHLQSGTRRGCKTICRLCRVMMMTVGTYYKACNFQQNAHSCRLLIDRLVRAYRPGAESLCRKIADALEGTADSISDASGMQHESFCPCGYLEDPWADASMRSLIFIGRIADEFTTSSTFVMRLGCEPSAISGWCLIQLKCKSLFRNTDFHKRMAALYDRTIERWRGHAIQRIILQSWSNDVCNSYYAHKGETFL